MKTSGRVQRFRRPRGFLVMDAVWAVILALVLLMIMSTVIFRQRGAENRLAAIRAATRGAETALLDLQAGQPAPPDVRIEKLPDAAPPGHAWVRVAQPITPENRKAGPGAKEASLIGLVPAAALESRGAAR